MRERVRKSGLGRDCRDTTKANPEPKKDQREGEIRLKDSKPQLLQRPS